MGKEGRKGWEKDKRKEEKMKKDERRVKERQ